VPTYKTVKQAKLRNKPGLTISNILIFPAVKTIAFGGLEVGSTKAYWQAMAPANDKYRG